MENKISKRYIVIAGVIFLCCFLSWEILKRGCFWPECAPERSFSIYDLDIPEELYPDGAQVNLLTSDRDLGPIEEVHGGALWYPGRLVYLIRKFSTIPKAADRFEIEMKLRVIDFPANEGDINSSTYNFKSGTANQFDITCGYKTYDLRCIYRAQYEEFYIYLDASIDEQFSTDDFLAIVSFVDAKLVELLR